MLLSQKPRSREGVARARRASARPAVGAEGRRALVSKSSGVLAAFLHNTAHDPGPAPLALPSSRMEAPRSPRRSASRSRASPRIRKTFTVPRSARVGVGRVRASEAPLTGGPHRGLTRVMSALCARRRRGRREVPLGARARLRLREPRDLKVEVGLFKRPGSSTRRAMSWPRGRSRVRQAARAARRHHCSTDGTGRWETRSGPLRLTPPGGAALREYSRELPELPLDRRRIEQLLTKQTTTRSPC
jgi:hypothetical protein